jgi:hypothetical protein
VASLDCGVSRNQNIYFTASLLHKSNLVHTQLTERMTLIPDDLCLLLDQMRLSSPSSTSSTALSSGTTSALPPQESMTTIHRVHKLTELRATMHQRLILLLKRAQHVEGANREEIDAEVEEYRDLLDGMDVLIQGLQKRERQWRVTVFEEWRDMDEL